MSLQTLFKTTLFFYLFNVLAFAFSGTIDTSFGTNGVYVNNLFTNDESRSLVVDNKGRVIVSGFNSNSKGFIARLESNGSLDLDFNSTYGYTEISSLITIQKVALQADGKIIAVGNDSSDFVIVRLDENGTFDNSFGSSGVVKSDINGVDRATDVEIKDNGKIVVCGTSSGGGDNNLTIVQYNLDGTIDTSFGSSGKIVATDFIGGYDGMGAVISLQGDNIIAAFIGVDSAVNKIHLYKFDKNGSQLATNFSISAGDANYAYDIATLDDGTIFVAGQVNFNSNSSSIVWKIASDLSTTSTTFLPGFDDTYNQSVAGKDDMLYAIEVQKNNKIVVAGKYTNQNGTDLYDFALARLDSNGSVDPTFGTLGYVTHEITDSKNDGIYGLHISKDKLYAAGYTNDGVNNHFVVTKYLLDPSLKLQAHGGVIATDGASTTKAVAKVNLSSYNSYGHL